MCINSGRGMLRASPHLTQQPITEAVMSANIYTQTISEFCKELNPNFNTHEFWNEEIDPLYCEEIDHFRGVNNLFYGQKHTPETRKKMSEARMGEKNPRYGKKYSPETIKKMSEARMGEKNPRYGKKHSPEAIQKLSEAMMGNTNGVGYKHSPEAKQKMSEAHKGKKMPPITEEQRKKLSEAMKSAWAKRKEEALL